MAFGALSDQTILAEARLPCSNRTVSAEHESGSRTRGLGSANEELDLLACVLPVLAGRKMGKMSHSALDVVRPLCRRPDALLHGPQWVSSDGGLWS